MSLRKGNPSRRFFALLTILSFTFTPPLESPVPLQPLFLTGFTQACPLLASPEQGRRASPALALRPEMDKAGLEEAVLQQAPAAPLLPEEVDKIVSKWSEYKIWTDASGGWDSANPLATEGNAIRRLDALFKKHKEELPKDSQSWDLIVAALLAPGDEKVQAVLKSTPPQNFLCPACGAYVTRHAVEEAPRVNTEELAWDEAIMRVRHALEHDKIRHRSPEGAAIHDLNEIRALQSARSGGKGRNAYGVKLTERNDEKILNQILGLLQSKKGKSALARSVTVAVNRKGMPHFIKFFVAADGGVRLLDRDRTFRVDRKFNRAAFLEGNRQWNLTVLVETSLGEGKFGESLPKGLGLAKEFELEEVTGCCGVAGVVVLQPEWARGSIGEVFEKGLSLDSPRSLYEWIGEPINPEGVVDRVLGREEVRGDDNFGVAELFEIPLASLSLSKEKLAEILKSQAETGNVRLIFREDGTPEALRFWGTSRGVGGLTANLGLRDRKMQDAVEEWVKFLYGDNILIETYERTGNRLIKSRHGPKGILNWAILLGAWGHDRYATKGGYSADNAHHWLWHGFTLSHNGDVEAFDVIRPVLESLGETFEGTTDSEAVLHLLGDLAQEKDSVGKPKKDQHGQIIYAKSQVAALRLLRVLEMIEALKQAAIILTTGEESQKKVIAETLQKFNMDPEDFTIPDDEAPTVSVGIANAIQAAIANPSRFDAVPNWLGVPFLAQAFYRALEEKGLSVKDSVFGEEQQDGRFSGKGNNFSLNIRSIHDDNGLTVVRGIPTSTASYLAWGYDRSGNVNRLIATSELYGAAPEKGVGKIIGEPVVVAPGVIQMANGQVRAHTMGEWSVCVSSPNLQVTEFPAFVGVPQAVEPKTEEVRWNDILDLGAYNQFPAYVWEYRMGGRSLWHTLRHLFPHKRTTSVMESLKNDYVGLTAEGRRALFGIGGKPAKKIVAFGTGSSFNAIESGQTVHGQFNAKDQSDAVRTAWPPYVDQDTAVIVISQSGSTGTATWVARRAKEVGATVIALTNVEGSPLDSLTSQYGGTLVTQCTIEQALASNVT